MSDPDQPNRCPLNVPGPFYTQGYCLACGLPEDDAPDLLAALNDHNNITHFIKQPQTPDEIERACIALGVCCVFDLRYGGTDPHIINRLGNDPRLCDHVFAPDGDLVRVQHAFPAGPSLPTPGHPVDHASFWSPDRYSEPFAIAAFNSTILMMGVVVPLTVIARHSHLLTFLISSAIVILGSTAHAYIGAAAGARNSSLLMLGAGSLLGILYWFLRGRLF